MIEQELQRKIEDFRALGIPSYVPREGKVHLVEHAVSTVIGARRSGKSYRVLQVAEELIQEGFIESPRHVCHVDFDNPVLAAMTAADLKLVQRAFLKLSPGFGLKTPLVFIFDEIHRIQGWEDYVVDLSRHSHWKVIVTGSSSRLMRSDVSTALRGKAVSSIVYPLSFAERVRFEETRANPASTQGQAETQRLFDDYLTWGAFPAIPRTPESSREALLRDYFETMTLRDILERHNVSKPRQCLQLYRYLLSSIGRPWTLKSAYEFLRIGGQATSRDAIRDYLDWAEDAWFLFTVPVHSDSQKEQERNYRKVYCIDWALAVRNSPVWDGSYSRALENLVFLHLARRFPTVRYYKTRSTRREVDFLASDARGKPALAVQVCADISAPDTLRRELDPLVSTIRYFGLREGQVITLSEERRIEVDGVVVNVAPAWKWLLG
jgi:predicted AAA+ superfamily ATPase